MHHQAKIPKISTPHRTLVHPPPYWTPTQKNYIPSYDPAIRKQKFKDA